MCVFSFSEMRIYFRGLLKIYTHIFIGTHRSIFIKLFIIPHSNYDLSINVLKEYFSLSVMEIEFILALRKSYLKTLPKEFLFADFAFPLSAHKHTYTLTHTRCMQCARCLIYNNNLILYVPLAHTKRTSVTICVAANYLK